MGNQRFLSVVFLGILSVFASLNAFSATPPTPTGYSTGGIFSDYFRNIVTGNDVSGVCPIGQAIAGFNTGNIIAANYGKPVCIAVSSSAGWNLVGNGGTNAITNFLGTTDATDLVIRTNNTEAARVTADQKFIIGNGASVGTALNFGVFGGTTNILTFLTSS